MQSRILRVCIGLAFQGAAAFQMEEEHHPPALANVRLATSGPGSGEAPPGSEILSGDGLTRTAREPAEILSALFRRQMAPSAGRTRQPSGSAFGDSSVGGVAGPLTRPTRASEDHRRCTPRLIAQKKKWNLGTDCSREAGGLG